jgi:hypothetical protein
VREVIPPLVKLLRDLFSNPITAKDFFFVNDLKVLVEIIMREVTDTSDAKVSLPHHTRTRTTHGSLTGPS